MKALRGRPLGPTSQQLGTAIPPSTLMMGNLGGKFPWAVVSRLFLGAAFRLRPPERPGPRSLHLMRLCESAVWTWPNCTNTNGCPNGLATPVTKAVRPFRELEPVLRVRTGQTGD